LGRSAAPAAVRRRRRNDKKVAEIDATNAAAKYANDPQGYMGELAKQQTTYRRDAYAAHAGIVWAQHYQGAVRRLVRHEVRQGQR
jgi:hypothetical protein